MNIYEQAAAIPFRVENGRLKILLITSRNNKKWIIPKGIIENGDGASVTALRETQEEAGVSGEIIAEELGTYEYVKWGGICRVKVFPLKVTEEFREWDEMDFRSREWMDEKTALKKVQPSGLKKLIREFIKKIQG